MSANYSSDLTDGQWRILQRYLPPANGRGRPRVDRRRVINAILYVARTGCQWRQLPHDFPNWKTVYTVFWRWRTTRFWHRLHHRLRRKVRKMSHRKPTPSVAILDSQSIRTAEGGEERGYDAGKKITGRKRHLAVDTLGLVSAAVVHGAHWQDQDGACFVLHRLQETCRRVKVIFADSAYARNDLPGWVRETFGWKLQTVLRPVGVKGFVALPKRWIVERTFAWLARHRRHSKDYERNTTQARL